VLGVRLPFRIALVALLAWIVIPYKSVNQTLDVYYTNFNNKVIEKCGNKYNSNKHIIRFAKLIRPTIGQCSSVLGGFMIEIDALFWDIANENDKYNVMTHELSHCILKENHSITDYPHYMNDTMNELSIDVINKQLDDVIERKCSNGK
jgi:hypothetical protein